MAFFVHLPSNSSHKYFENNRASFYRTQLPRTLYLDHNNFEVALTEASFINSFIQFPSVDDKTISIYIPQSSSETKENFKFDIILSSSHYGDIHQLVKSFSLAVSSKLLNTNILSYDKESNRVVFNVSGTRICKINLNERVARAFGFRTEEIQFKKEIQQYVAECPPDLLLGQTRIFIYSDIIAPQIVGDTYAPLLSVVPLSGGEREVITHYPLRNYVPLARSPISTINILLCNEYGDEVNLENSTSCVTLHFRPKIESNHRHHPQV